MGAPVASWGRGALQHKYTLLLRARALVGSVLGILAAQQENMRRWSRNTCVRLGELSSILPHSHQPGTAQLIALPGLSSSAGPFSRSGALRSVQ